MLDEVKSHFATLPMTVAEFDHYGPAEYLLIHGAKIKRSLPKLDEALDRFERLFSDLNKLLPKA